MKRKQTLQLFTVGMLMMGSISSLLVYGDESTTNTVESTMTSEQSPLTSTQDTLTSSEATSTTDTTATTESTETSDTSMVEETSTNSKINTVDTTTSSEFAPTIESVAPEIQVSIIDGINGDGTESAPFEVNDFVQMNKVASMISTKNYYTVTNVGSVYIKLMGDITSDGSGAAFSNNPYPIIIDGTAPTGEGVDGKFSIFYTGGTTKSGGIFSLNSDGMSITFSNINFGSKTYSSSTYYGFCEISQKNCILTVDNINYYAEYGGQPFYMGASSSYVNTLNFRGNNRFEVPAPGTNNQEFAEMQGTINFEENSSTNIIHKTKIVDAIIWNRNNLTINLGKSAQVNIDSGKNEFFYSDGSNKDINFFLDEGSSFNFTNDSSLTSQSNNYLTYGTNNISFTLKENANMTFNSNGNPLQLRIPLTINTSDVEAVKFLNNGSVTQPAVKNNTITFNMMNEKNFYLFELKGITSSSNKSELVTSVAQTRVFSSSELSKYNALVYQPAITIDGFTASGESGAGVSRINSRLTGVTSYLDDTYTLNTQYYVTKGTDQPTDQTTIASTDSSTDATDTHDSGQLSFKPDSLADTTGTVNDLVTGTYQSYGRIQIIAQDGSTVYTPWQSAATTIEPYQAVVIPSNIDLNDPGVMSYGMINGKLDTIFNQEKQFTIVNQSNQAVAVTPTNMQAQSANEVTVVSLLQDPLAARELALGFQFANQEWDLGADFLSTDTLTLAPYWSDTNTVAFTIKGQYGGPAMSAAPANLAYHLELGFSWDPN